MSRRRSEGHRSIGVFVMQLAPQWIGVLNALLTPTIAILGIYIAWQQWNLGRNKLKYDLFEKRFRLYLAVRRAVDYVMLHARMDHETLMAFIKDTRDVKWLCSTEVQGYLDGPLREKLSRLRMLCAEIDGLPVGDERTQNARAQREAIDWIEQQITEIDKKFEPFLRLKH